MKINFCTGLLYGRAGRLNTKNAGFRPGQWKEQAQAQREAADRNIALAAQAQARAMAQAAGGGAASKVKFTGLTQTLGQR